MRNSLIEFNLYGSATAFIVSILLKAIKVSPWFWHAIVICLVIIPLLAIAFSLYKSNNQQQEDDLLSVLKHQEDKPDEKQELIDLIFKWWILRLLPMAIGVELVFWGYL